MEQFGIIVSNEGQVATVAVRRHASCERCGVCKFGSSSSMLVVASNEIGAQVGDSVIMELKSSTVLAASAIVYAIPLLLMVIGFLVGPRILNFLGVQLNQDIAAFVVGLCMLAVGFAGVHIYDKRAGARKYMPRIVSIVSPEKQPGCD